MSYPYPNNSATTERNQNKLLNGCSIRRTEWLFNYADNCWFYKPSRNMRVENWWNERYWQGKTLVIWPPQIPHGLTWDQTWPSVVKGRRLTSWATVRLNCINIILKIMLCILYVFMNAILDAENAVELRAWLRCGMGHTCLYHSVLFVLSEHCKPHLGTKSDALEKIRTTSKFRM